MHKQMSSLFIAMILMTLLATQAAGFPANGTQIGTTTRQAINLTGRWHVKFTVSGVEKNLIFESRAKGFGSFLLLDTEPNNRPAANPQPAAWSQLTNNRISFSGEVELPIGTCCREIGTLIFKGNLTSSNAISGKLIFVTSVDEEESPYQFRSLVGTFTASRVP